jgi:long-chain acyl-CoA synthetase
MTETKFKNFYEIICFNANKSPNKTIIFQDDQKISCKQLKDLVDKTSESLNKIGVKNNDKVALVMSNCWQFVVNVFAISKVGAIIVPINNFLKEDELAYILNDSQAKLLFSSAKFASQTKNLICKTGINKIIWVDESPISNEENLSFERLIKDIETKNMTQPVEKSINDTAIIVYTSGTTGKPKGAMLSFKNIFSNCSGAQKMMQVKPTQLPMICYLPMFHAFTLTVNVLLPIYLRSNIVIVKSLSSKKDFKYLLKQLLLKRCPYFTGVPEVYSALAKAKLPWYFHWFHNVKGFISGAAPLPDEVSKKFTASFSRGKLLQGYGIGECSPVVSCNTPFANKFGSVGQPLDGYQIRICDDDNQEVPIGQLGEICVKGDCVMQGYYNRPEETEKAIVDGWFHTGDVGKVDQEGYIYIVDRKKDLIIHKGMNIYPREIEEVLYTNVKVEACAVVGMTDPESGEIPVAFIELKEDIQATETEMKDFLKPQLANFKMPRKIVFTQNLPRNATGKILKRELREQIKAQ